MRRCAAAHDVDVPLTNRSPGRPTAAANARPRGHARSARPVLRHRSPVEPEPDCCARHGRPPAPQEKRNGHEKVVNRVRPDRRIAGADDGLRPAVRTHHRRLHQRRPAREIRARRQRRSAKRRRRDARRQPDPALRSPPDRPPEAAGRHDGRPGRRRLSEHAWRAGRAAELRPARHPDPAAERPVLARRQPLGPRQDSGPAGVDQFLRRRRQRGHRQHRHGRGLHASRPRAQHVAQPVRNPRQRGRRRRRRVRGRRVRHRRREP